MTDDALKDNVKEAWADVGIKQQLAVHEGIYLVMERMKRVTTYSIGRSSPPPECSSGKVAASWQDEGTTDQEASANEAGP